MTFAYFPGCTLKNKAQALDACARCAAEALGFSLEELPEWQCCGAVYPMARDEIAPKLSAVRALADANAAGRELVTLCSACHNVIKHVNYDLQHDAQIREKVNNYLQLDTPYGGETNVLHYLEVLRDRIGWDAVAAKVKKPLTGRKIGAYYGCLLLRPGKVMQMDDGENPRILEDFIRAIGAEPVIYAQRNECCGAYVTLENKAAAQSRAAQILQNAKAQGAQSIVTACPLCYYNLKENGNGVLPVAYFTQLLAEALGAEEETK